MRRRGPRGEGSIYQRTDGRWVAQVPGPDGERRYAYCRTKRDAVAARRRLLAEVQAGIAARDASQTLSAFWPRYRDVAAGNLKPQSLARYDETWRLHIEPEFGGTRLDRLTTTRIQEWVSKHRERPALIGRAYKILRRVLSYAVRWQLLARNPTDGVETPRIAASKPEPLTQDEARAFVGAVWGDALEAYWLLAILTGMRKCEILALQWADLQDGALHVRHTLARLKVDGRYQLVLSPAKSGKSVRRIDLPPAILESLARHRARQEQRRAPDWPDPQPYVFVTSRGKPIWPQSLGEDKFPLVLKRAGITRHVRFHDLRHSTASLLIALDVHLKTIQGLLGHASVRTTGDVYGHLLPGVQADATAALAQLVRADQAPDEG
jgi:integrase